MRASTAGRIFFSVSISWVSMLMRICLNRANVAISAGFRMREKFDTAIIGTPKSRISLAYRSQPS